MITVDYLNGMMKDCFGPYFQELNKNVIAPDWETDNHYGIKLLDDTMHYKQHDPTPGAFTIDPYPKARSINLSGRYYFYTNRLSIPYEMASNFMRGSISNFKFKMGRYLDKVIPQIKRKRMFGPHKYSVGKAYCTPYRDGINYNEILVVN